ncbi:MAG: DUF2914 domain-containing protein [Myxococcota bacterium]
MSKRSLAWIPLAGLLLAAPAAADHHEDLEDPAGPESVTRALFTAEVVDREPGDALSHVPADIGAVFFFTELTDLAGHTVVHRWEWNGQLMAEVSFEVRGPRWRVWSTKRLLPEWLGDWQVTVVDGGGAVLATRSLTVAEAAAAGDVPTPEEMSAPAAEHPGDAL